jgi:hypothetical protein
MARSELATYGLRNPIAADVSRNDGRTLSELAVCEVDLDTFESDFAKPGCSNVATNAIASLLEDSRTSWLANADPVRLRRKLLLLLMQIENIE